MNEKVKKSKRLAYICSHCGSNNVTRDANAHWDVRAQQWKLEGLNDSAYCHECDGETSLQEVVLEHE